VITQIVPLSRPDCVPEVLAGFARQTHQAKRLVLAVNGPHAGECMTALEDSTAWVIRTPPGKPAALNHALALVGPGLVAIRDDDDIQLPGDLEECEAAMRETGASIVSRHKHWVWDRKVDQLWLLGEHRAHQWGNDQVSGGSLLFRNAPGLPEFPDIRVGESMIWAKRMIERGARVWRPSINHQVFVRGRSDHLFESPDAIAIYAKAPKARLYGKPAAVHQAMCRGVYGPLELPHTVEDL
jgi:hypothetical protein